MLVQKAPSTTRERVRVLVVDDNTGFRDSLVSLLDTDELMVVGQAGNGAQALELFATTRPDVVLMDVRMPLMDGIETTRRLKALDPDIGIVGSRALRRRVVSMPSIIGIRTSINTTSGLVVAMSSSAWDPLPA